MDDRHIAHWRMHNLRLSGAALEAPEDVVRWLGAVQSQDYGPAKWALAARTGGVSDDAIDRAFAQGTILRTHVLRPTWHFVLPADIRWMLELTAPRVHAFNAYYYRQAELTDVLLDRCNAVLTRALQGGNQLTRKEIKATLASAGIAAEGLRLGYILMNAELSCILCSGALKGKQHSYALLDERAPQAKSLPHDEALATLTLRYFTSHGPATVKDFKWWSSLTVAEIKKGLEMVAAKLEHEVIDGVTYWFAAPAPRTKAASPTVHLLQGYDEYLVGYSESKYVLDVSGVARTPAAEDKVVFNHVVILDGQVAGNWKRTLKKGSVLIEVSLYQLFNAAQTRGLQGAAQRHGEFLGLTATVVTRSPVVTR
jgi:hypothetical protein